MPLNVGSSLTFKQLTTTAPTPSAGNQSIYVGTTGQAERIDSSGVAQKLLDSSDWIKPDVRAATTANITLSGTQTVDGIALAVGDRVLVKNQSTAAQNGIYVVASGSWTRSADTGSSALMAGAAVAVITGTQAGRTYQTKFKATDTLGTSAVDWWYYVDSLSGASLYASNDDPHLFRDVRAVSIVSVSLAGASTTMDGVTLVAGDRVLLTNQSPDSQNGIYVVGTVSAGTAPLTRDSHFNTSAAIANAGVIEVTEGSVFGGGGWMTTFKSSDTLGTTSMAWGQVPSPRSSGGRGLLVSGSDTGTGAKPSVLTVGSPGQLLTSNGTDMSWATNNMQILTTPWKDWVVTSTTTNITLSGTQVIDGVSVLAGQRVLVKNQTTASQNGVYICSAGAWTRAPGFDTTAEASGSTVAVAGGILNGGSTWYSTFKTGNTLGTTSLQFLPIALEGTWVPALTAATTNPTLGTGSVRTGMYTLTGKICTFTVIVQFGTSGINVGSGNYQISLPIPTVQNESFFGTARNSSNPYVWVSENIAGDPTLVLKALPTTAGNPTANLTNSSPTTWTAGARFTCNGSYHWTL